MKITTEQLRRIITESISVDTQGIKVDGLAALFEYEGNQRTAVVIDAAAAAELAEMLDSPKPPSSGKLQTMLQTRVIKGLIMVAEPASSECWGAWEVKFSAGRGMGKLLYGLGYAMTPSRLLMPDRKKVSDDAGFAWDKMSGKTKDMTDAATQKRSSSRDVAGTLSRIKFDDERNPKTDIPEDDCRIHNSREHLNYAYRSDGSEMAAMGSMKAAAANMEREVGKETMAKLRAAVMDSDALQTFFTDQRGY